jgi:hypothetical protein
MSEIQDVQAGGKLMFRFQLRRAARMSYLSGKISKEDWNEVQSVLAKPWRKTPEGVDVDLLDEIAQDCKEQLVVENQVASDTDVGKIDWTNLFTWMKENLPSIISFIMQLMALFGA